MNRISNKSAMAYMAISIILYSTLPLIISVGEGVNSPFLFNALLNFFGALICAFYLAVRHRDFVYNEHVITRLKSSFKRKDILIASVGNLDYAFFPLALIYIDVSVATVLLETWPLIMILMTVYLLKAKNLQNTGYQKITTSSYAIMIMAFFGFGFIIFSQVEHSSLILHSLFNEKSILGIAIAFFAAFLSGLVPAYTLVYGLECNNEHNKEHNKEHDQEHDQDYLFPFLIAGMSISLAIGGCIALVIGVLSGESISDTYLIMTGVLGGLLMGLASIFLRMAYTKTDNLGISIMSYLTPILALFWLGSSSFIQVPQIDLLVIGCIAIIVGNILINIKASVRLGYKMLITALWSFGAFAYLLTSVPISADAYYNIIAIVTTMYILLLSFRLDRFVRRTSDEENRAVLLLKNIDKGIALKLLDEEIDAPKEKYARQLLQEIDAPENTTTLFESYGKMKQILYDAKAKQKARKDKNASDDIASNIDRIAKIDSDIDAFALSKQQGNNFGELVAMAILGFITIAVALVVYPSNICGVEGFTVKMFAMLLATIVVFLFANIVDLSNDRNSTIVKENENTSEGEWKFGIVFRDTKSRRFERWLSSIICAVIIIVYAYFLLGKWVWVGGEFVC